MKHARFVVLGLSVIAGGIAAYLAGGSDNKAPELAGAAPQLRTVNVLVASRDLGLGDKIGTDDLQWQSWPADTASSASLIKQDERKDAASEFVGAVVRSGFFAGEPVRDAKLVKANGSGFMAAILPSGARAMSVEISPETGAGGFILPNDRVDVILTRRGSGDAREATAMKSEVVLDNIRVLAIDQATEEKNGQKVVIGKTATLELRPNQAEALAQSRQLGTLSLALRSITDSKSTDGDQSRTLIVYRGASKELLLCNPLCR